MAKTISFRPTPEDRVMLERLGANPTEAIRTALAMARRRLDEEELAREAARLAADPAEQSEAEELLGFMGDTFGDLPE